jgi:P4 family phage/plasmid primase-like protien
MEDKERAKFIKTNQKSSLVMAQAFIEENTNIISHGGNLYRYNSKCYDLMSETDIDTVFLEFCNKYSLDTAWKNISSTLRAFSVHPNIKKLENTDENSICVNNGIINLNTADLINHSPDLFYDSCINVDYDKSVGMACPVFLKYLEHTFNKDEKTIANVIRLGGYLLDTSCKAKKMFMFDGPGGCLDRDTFIPYRIISSGKSINNKGGSIEMLYERFHNKPTARGKGGYHLRSKDKNLSFYISSINECNSVFKNKIVDVIKSGVKKCYKLTTSLGKEIIATNNHKFYNGKKYIALKKLVVGDIVYIHNNTHYKNKKKTKVKQYREINIKYHPDWPERIINGSRYCRGTRSRATVEAELNNMSYKDYIKVLNTRSKKFIDTLIFVSKDYEIHHINKNCRDDRLENLKVLTIIDHHKIHNKDNYDRMRFVVVPDTIKSIECVGKRETYDIKCLYPYNNFIAGGIVVHNSGKSTLIDTFSMFFIESMDSRNQITSLSLEELAGNGFDKALLINSRFNTCAETKKGFLDAEEIKKIITGDIVKVREVYSKAVNFRPKTKIVVACNGLPTFKDNSDAIFRRIQIIEFKNQYKSPSDYARIKDAEEKGIYLYDADLLDKIKAEKSAILNLFIGGLLDLKKNNYEFIDSEASYEAMVNFRRGSDTVREFLEDTYEVDKDSEMSLGDIYENYRCWYSFNVSNSILKFRKAELGKRVADIFKVKALGRKYVYNNQTQRSEKETMYPISLIEPVEEEHIATPEEKAAIEKELGLKF